MSNTIDSPLLLNRVLGSSLRAFKRALLPISAFSTVYRREPLQGTDTIAVPYYPLNGNTSGTRAAGGSYAALAGNTSVGSRSITPTRNKVQAISFTTEELNRQPAFDPEMHGMLIGEKLAYDVLDDILRVISAGRYTGDTITASTAANFDEGDVADLGVKCDDAYWPEGDRSLILRPAFGFNLLKQAAIIDASQYGSTDGIRDAKIPRLLGFNVFRNAGVPTNVGITEVATANATTNVVTNTTNAYPLRDLDRVRFTTTNTLPAGLSVDTDYYVFAADVSAGTFKVATTAANAVAGTQVDITDTGTGTHSVTRREDLGGFAVTRSAILTAFAPLTPSRAMQSQLADYQVVEDDDSDLTIEYKHIVYPDTNKEVQVIECNYGVAYGEVAALKRIEDATLRAV